jgi:S-adenosylmethionine decarboxylase
MTAADASFFEGTEKKVEIIVDESARSLRSMGDARWARIVAAAAAEVLSKISSARCDAYLLSESSLFVFDRKMIMITCGQTRLHEAVVDFLRDVRADQVRLFVYERKNEVFPRRQPTSFFEDARALGRQFPGRAFQFGNEDEHYLHLFHLDRAFSGDAGDLTVEVLMYGVDPQVRAHFTRRSRAATAEVRAATGVAEIVPGFAVDDHLFEPSGYSLNAVRDDEYFTIHVTPGELRSYASFETNHRPANGTEGIRSVVHRVLDVFRPRSFDLVLFDRAGETRIPVEGYRLGAHVTQQLVCGYHVGFLSFYRPQAQVVPAIELPLSGAPWR